MKAKQTRILAVLVLTSAWVCHGEEPNANAGRDGKAGSRTNAGWRVQAGWVHQWNRGMSVRGPAPMPSTGGRRSLSGAAGLTYPDNNAPIAREFDDGYVRPDLWTGDTGVPADRQGMTWNWGVDNAGQYNYDGGVHPTLTFHRDRGEAVGGAYSTTGGQSDDDFSSDGVEVKAMHLLRSWTKGGGTSNQPNAKVSLNMNLVVGLAWFPANKQTHRRAMEQDVYSLSETYTYLDYYGTEAGGSWPALDVPYSGSYGSVGGTDAGPLIPAMPESATLDSAYLGKLRNNVEIESKLWRLRGEVGIAFEKPLTDRLTVYVAPQFVLEFVDMSVERDESGSGGGTATSRSDSKHKMAVYPGVLLTAGADYRLSENWYAGASVGYEWLFEDPSVNVGPDRVKYDLNGGELSLYVGRSF